MVATFGFFPGNTPGDQQELSMTLLVFRFRFGVNAGQIVFTFNL